MRCSSRSGFQGNSMLRTSRHRACRFRPSPAASVAISARAPAGEIVDGLAASRGGARRAARPASSRPSRPCEFRNRVAILAEDDGRLVGPLQKPSEQSKLRQSHVALSRPARSGDRATTLPLAIVQPAHPKASALGTSASSQSLSHGSSGCEPGSVCPRAAARRRSSVRSARGLDAARRAMTLATGSRAGARLVPAPDRACVVRAFVEQRALRRRSSA